MSIIQGGPRYMNEIMSQRDERIDPIYLPNPDV